MSNEITPTVQPFDFNGHNVRVVMRDGEPWFVAADVCVILEIGNTSDAVGRLDGADLGQAEVRNTRGEMRPTNVINESGLWELVIRSDKPEAKPFRRWVTSEVLPSIRRTGGYSLAAPTLSPLDTLQAMIDQLRAQEARALAIESRTAVIEAKVSAGAGEYDEFTTLAYAKLNDLPTDRVSCQKHGQRATRLMRQRGTAPRKRQDATFGKVNVYPVAFLDETADEA